MRKQFSGNANLPLPGIKIFADGVLEYPAQSAALLGRYINSGKQGEMLFDRRNLIDLVDASDERGRLVHIHALGDRAVLLSLDAIAEARKNRNSRIDDSISHLLVVHPSTYPSLAQSGVIVVMQLQLAKVDNYLLDLVKPYTREQDFKGQYPAKSLQ